MLWCQSQKLLKKKLILNIRSYPHNHTLSQKFEIEKKGVIMLIKDTKKKLNIFPIFHT